MTKRLKIYRWFRQHGHSRRRALLVVLRYAHTLEVTD